MLTLENRRRMFDLISKYKEESMKDGTVPDGSTRMTRSKADKQLEKPRFRLDIRKHSYSMRVIDNWNDLPITIRNSSSINTFKKNVKDYLMTKQ